MRSALKKCDYERCPRYEQLALEMSQSQNYLSIMNETINAECCKANYKFIAETPTGLVNLQGTIYKDNLNDKNWYYGDITQKDYTLKRFQLATKYNLTSCPIDMPYADLTQNKCGRCPQPGMYFNLGSRQCLSCGTANTYLNLTTGECQTCPARSFYNPVTRTCDTCPIGSVYNATVGKCQVCGKNQFPNYDTFKCQNCPPQQYFNVSTQQCQQCNMVGG